MWPDNVAKQNTLNWYRRNVCGTYVYLPTTWAIGVRCIPFDRLDDSEQDEFLTYSDAIDNPPIDPGIN